MSAISQVCKRVAFLGAGDISNLHFAAIQRSPLAQLVGLWNRKDCPIVPDAAAKAREYNCRCYDSAEDVMLDPNVDAVYVLTNMESHSRFAQQALNAGKPVYIEKPVASSIDEIHEIQACADANGVTVMPGHNYIYEPGVQRMKTMVDNGDIGEPCSLEIHYNIHHPESVCSRLPGIIRQILTHHAYTTLYLLGHAPHEVTGMSSVVNDGSIVDRENIAMVLMQHPKDLTPGIIGGHGPISLLQASFAADDHSSDPWSFHIKLLGTKGSARYSYNDWVANDQHIVHSHTYLAYPETICASSSYFLDEVLTRGKKPLSTLEDAKICQQIIEAAETSITERRHVKLSEF